MKTEFAIPHKMKSLEVAMSCIKELGISGEACLVKTGISPASISSADTEVRIGQELTFYRNIATKNVDGPIGLQIGKAYRIENYGIWGLAIRSAETFRRSIEIAREFQSLTYTFFNYGFSVDGDIASITLSPIADFGDCLDILADRDIAATLLILNQVLGRDIPLIDIELMHNAKGYEQVYKDHYDCPVSFNKDSYKISFPASTLELIPPQSNPDTAQFCARECERLQSEIRNKISLSDKVYQRLALSPGDFPSPENLASELGLTYRTLRRQLKQQGTGYQSILNAVKFEYAKKLLASPKNSLSNISGKLGFSEPGNFTHAFKRWSGKTPKDYRADMG